MVGAPESAVMKTALGLLMPPLIRGTETAIPSGILCMPMRMASTSAALPITPLLLA